MKKWIPNIFLIDELELLEEYLEHQAAQGWILERVGLRGFTLKKSEPRTLRYCVDIPSVRRQRGGTNHYLQPYYEMCAEAGWTLVGTDTCIHVFVTEDETVAPIHTDPHVRYEAAESFLGDRSGLSGVLFLILAIMILPVFPWALQIGNEKLIFMMAVLLLGMVLTGESVYSRHRWRHAHEQARITGQWKRPKRIWQIYLRGILRGIFESGLLVAYWFLLETHLETEVATVYDVARLVLQPPIRTILLAVGAYVGTRFFWKRGLDGDSGRTIGVVLGCIVIFLVVAGSNLLEGDKNFKETGTTTQIQMGKIKEAPLTTEMLGIHSTGKPSYTRERGGTATTFKYEEWLGNGEKFSYVYRLFLDELSASQMWNSQYELDQFGIDSESVYGTREWIDTDLSALGTDHATVLRYRTGDGETTEYQYNIQRGNVQLSVSYSRGLLTQEQLQMIADLLPWE